MEQKIEHRLLNEISKKRQLASKIDKSKQRPVVERFEVTIELEKAIKPVMMKNRDEAIKALKDETKKHQSDIINLLSSLGITNFQALYLSNSIKTYLTSEQIFKIAEHPDVKIIKLVKPEIIIT